MAVSAAVIFSSITALTLSPALCSKLLKPSNKESKFNQYNHCTIESFPQNTYKGKKSIYIVIDEPGISVLEIILVT